MKRRLEVNILSKSVLYYTFVSISIGQLFAQYLQHLVANTTFSRFTIEMRENTRIRMLWVKRGHVIIKNKE